MTPEQALTHLKAMSDAAPAPVAAHVTSLEATKVLADLIAAQGPTGIVLPDAPEPNRATRRAAKDSPKAKAQPA